LDDSLIVAFFQDEQAFTSDRLRFVDDFNVHTVYTCLLAPHAARLYGARTTAAEVVSYVPGYIGERLLGASKRLRRPDANRPIDVGYRGRRLPAHWGGLAAEKALIGIEFAQRAADSGLVLDIEIDEGKRFRGDDWYRFIGACRAMLGTESGASVLDVDGVVPATAQRHGLGARALDQAIALQLASQTDAFPYRTISPRHLEAAAFETAQILFPGEYAGLLEANVHYLPLARDFANLDEVIDRFRHPSERRRIAVAARQDLVDSGRLSYRRFVSELDARLRDAGVRAPDDRDSEQERVGRVLYGSRITRRFRSAVNIARSYAGPARDLATARLRSVRRDA
jgi:hypothetical protein